MRLKIVAATAAFAAALAACASTDEKLEYASLEEDPRVGELDNQVCFSRSVRGFSVYQDGEGLVLSRGGDRYLVTFAGVCTAARNAMAIGFDQRFGGGCITRGDRIYMTSNPTGRPGLSRLDTDVCRIQEIYEFDPDAAKAEENEEEQS